MHRKTLQSLAASVSIAAMLNLAACGDSSPPAKTFTKIHELDTTGLKLEGKLTLYTGKDGRNFLLEQTQEFVSGTFFQDGKPLELSLEFAPGTKTKSITHWSRSDHYNPQARGLGGLVLHFLPDREPSEPYVHQSDIDALVKFGEEYLRSGKLPEGYSMTQPINGLELEIGTIPKEAIMQGSLRRRVRNPASLEQPAPTPDP